MLKIKEIQEYLIKNNVLSKIDDDIDFFEYIKNGNTIFYITLSGTKKVHKDVCKVLWNKGTSNIIISVDINNHNSYIGDIRNFEYSNINNSDINLKHLKLDSFYTENLLSLKNHERYEQILNNISNSFKNHGNFGKKFNDLIESKKEKNTVNKELLNDLIKVFKILRRRNTVINGVDDIDKTLVKVILQMLFVCFLKDNKIEIIPQHIKNMGELYSLFKDIKTKFNGELFDEKELKIWKNSDFNNEENFDTLKKVFLDRIGNFESPVLTLPLVDENNDLFFQKYNFKYIPTLLISNIYEGLLEFIYKQNKKKLGIFYTRPNVVKSILNRHYKIDFNNYDFENNFPTIYDPTCGSGVFLVSAFEMIINHLENKENKKLDFNARKKILENTIFGSDLEENSIYITEFSLYLELLKGLGSNYDQEINKFPNLLKSKNLIKGDSLLGGHFNQKTEKLTLDHNSKEISFKQKFDYIFGNPPWSKDIFSERYKKEIEKKLNLKSVEASESFIVKSQEYVKKGGKICLLTNSKNYYRNKGTKFRQFLLENFILDELINFNNINEYLFENTTEPATLVTLINLKKDTYDIKLLKVEESNFSKYYIFTLDGKNITLSKEKLLINIDKWGTLYKGDKYDLNLINYLINNHRKLETLVSNKSFSGFQLSTHSDKQKKFNEHIVTSKQDNNELFIDINDITNFIINKKLKYIDINYLKNNLIFHPGRDRSKEISIFLGNKILINSKNKYFAFTSDTSYFTNKTYVLKFSDKKIDFYYYILGILNSNIIKNYFIEQYSSRRGLDGGLRQDLIIEDIKNIPIPELEEENELYKKISQLSKEIYILHIQKEEEKIRKKEIELNKYIMISYNIFSDIDRQIIEDFDSKILEESVSTSDLNKYAKLFQEHFIESRAGILMTRQNIIGKEIHFKHGKNDFLGVSWICFSLKHGKISENLGELNKFFFLSSLKSENILDGIENSRVYLEDKKYLFIIKPNKKKYWTLSNAYKDSLYENELIFDNIKIK